MPESIVSQPPKLCQCPQRVVQSLKKLLQSNLLDCLQLNGRCFCCQLFSCAVSKIDQ